MLRCILAKGKKGGFEDILIDSFCFRKEKKWEKNKKGAFICFIIINKTWHVLL